MADKDTRPAEEKAISDAVDKAVDQHGALATVTMVERKLAEIRRTERSGDYPKVIYGPNGESRTVESKAQEKELGKGWGDKPSDEHRHSQAAASGAVAERREMVEAEAALRRARYLADPADSTSHSALHGSGVVVSADTTTALPGLLEPTKTVANVGADSKPVAAVAPPTPAPPPVPPAEPAKAAAPVPAPKA